MAENSTTVTGWAADALFKAGYEAGKTDAIDRCLIERQPAGDGDYRAHNVAVNLCIVAIRALDVRHALQRWRSE